jgi:vesicular inhibitory amino acid transporter
MLFFYLPVGIGCFVVFGGTIKDNIINNLNDTWLKTTVQVLITGHLLTAYNIILNPVFQGAEQAFNAPTKFGYQRVLIRGAVLLAVLFVAQSIPNFGPILSFIGGSTIALSSFILPCVFYYLLCKQPKYNM